MTPTKTEKKIEETFELLKVSAIAESKTNPRRTFNEAAMGQLISSIESEGVIEPIIVRPHPSPKNGTTHEIVAGTRRLRASALAGRKTIPSIIRQYTDEQVIIVQTVENLQREDVHPLEESDGYKRLLQIDGYTPEVIAEKIGHPANYVYKRLAFGTLIEEIRESFLKGEIHIGHAGKLARLPEDNQRYAFRELLFEEGSRFIPGRGYVTFSKAAVSVAELDDRIKNDIFLDLSGAPWKKDDATLLPAAGACSNCPKRSGARASLFDDLPAKGVDMCLDNVCFSAKADAFLIQIQATKKAAGVELKLLSTQWQLEANANPAITRSGYEEIEKKSNKCDSITEGVFVDGPRKGQTVRVCADPECSVHTNQPTSSRSSAAPEKSYWDVKAEKLESNIKVAVRRATVEAILQTSFKWTVPHEQLQVIAMTLLGGQPTMPELLDALALPGVPLGQNLKGSEVSEKLQDFIAAGKGTAKGSELPRIVTALALKEPMKEFAYGTEEQLKSAAKAFGVDDKKIAAEVSKTMRAEFAEKRAKAEARKAAKEPKSATEAEAPKVKAKAKAKAKPAKKAAKK